MMPELRCDAVLEQGKQHEHHCELDLADHPLTYHLCVCGKRWERATLDEPLTDDRFTARALSSVWLPCPNDCGQSIRYAVVLALRGGPLQLTPVVVSSIVRPASHTCPLRVLP